MKKLIVTLVVALTTTLAASQTTSAAGAPVSWPSKPLTLLVGFPPGGGVDIVARQLADKLSITVGQRVIVDNKPGAAGNLAMEAAARAAPDGHTLLMGNLGMLSANAALYPKLGIDPARDLAPVARVVVTPLLAVVPATLPARNAAEFVVLARSQPGTLNFGSGGNGNINHLASELFKLGAGLAIQHVPYKGSAPALTDLAAGRVQLMIDAGNVVQPFVRDGRLRVLFVTGETRSAGYDAPTAREAGWPDLVIYGWQGVLAPAGTPAAVIDKLSAAIAQALAQPDLASRLSAQGTEPACLDAAAFKRFTDAERTRWTEVIRAAKITVD